MTSSDRSQTMFQFVRFEIQLGREWPVIERANIAACMKG
jgi:hypothetical protein